MLLINRYIMESRFETGRGSGFGRDFMKQGKEPVKAKKARAQIFPSIAKALSTLDYGGIFSTTGSKRLYVVTKADWGKKSEGKVAKGFKEGTPFEEVKNFSIRTKDKHGASRSRKFKD